MQRSSGRSCQKWRRNSQPSPNDDGNRADHGCPVTFAMSRVAKQRRRIIIPQRVGNLCSLIGIPDAAHNEQPASMPLLVLPLCSLFLLPAVSRQSLLS